MRFQYKSKYSTTLWNNLITAFILNNIWRFLIYDFNFPITLKWAMVNSGLTVAVLGLAFLLFPFLFAKNPTLSKQKENELNERKRQR